jgi:uncharacterized protein
MKRILTLDGGGVHGVFSLQILRKMEQLLAPKYPDKKSFVLADYFDLIAGTSTGAIIASMLSWGASVDEIQRFYLAQVSHIFAPSAYWRRWIYNRFRSDGISDFLRGYFSEADGSAAPLGSARLRTLLLVVLRNATTGSPWPVTNNPGSVFNCRPAGQTNLDIPLWKIVRASTAAPTFFPAQRITVWSSKKQQMLPFDFIDGGVSPFNNPSYLAYLTATLPEYCINFPRGAEQLLLVSVGVGRREMHYSEGGVQDMHVLSHVRAIIRAMLDADSMNQDLLCRSTGLCLHGAVLDRELQSLVISDPAALAKAKSERQFSYVRYNHTYSDEEAANALQQTGGKWDLANLKLIPTAIATGRNYAEQNVSAAHLF